MPTLREHAKSQFKFANFWFNWQSERDFIEGKWQCISGLKYVTIRWFFAIYFIVFLSLSIWDYSQSSWFFALTSINYILCTIYFTYAAVHTTYRYKKPRSQLDGCTDGTQATEDVQQNPEQELKFRAKVHWFLYNLSLGSCTFVFIGFWVMLAPYRTRGYDPSLHTFLLIDRHGINLCFMAIDFLLNKIPLRLFHFVYTALLFGLYLVYNSIYWAVTGHLIYGKVLDYGSNPGMVVGLALAGCFVIIPLLHFGWFVLSFLKQSYFKNDRDTNANIEFENV